MTTVAVVVSVFVAVISPAVPGATAAAVASQCDKIPCGRTIYYYLFGYFTSMSAWLNYHWIKSYPLSKSQGVAAHELGHIAGLDHTNRCVLMVPNSPARASCGISTPQTDDRNGIAAMF